MPNNEELEKVAREMMSLYWGSDFDDTNLTTKTSHALKLAAWHIREKEIAVLENRIDAIRMMIPSTNKMWNNPDGNELSKQWSLRGHEFIEKLQSRLAELRKEK